MAIQLQRHEEGFWKKKKNRTKKKISPTWNRALECQNKTASVGTLSTWANEAAVRNNCVIVTSSFSETKGFFCFSFNNRSLKDATCKTEGCLHTLYLKNKEQTSRKIQGDVFQLNWRAHACKTSANLEQETETTKVVTYPLITSFFICWSTDLEFARIALLGNDVSVI